MCPVELLGEIQGTDVPQLICCSPQCDTALWTDGCYGIELAMIPLSVLVFIALLYLISK